MSPPKVGLYTYLMSIFMCLFASSHLIKTAQALSFEACLTF